jgi:hypothetical protein
LIVPNPLKPRRPVERRSKALKETTLPAASHRAWDAGIQPIGVYRRATGIFSIDLSIHRSIENHFNLLFLMIFRFFYLSEYLFMSRIKTALICALTAGPATRAELMTSTGISQATLSRAIAVLERDAFKD